MAEPWPSEIRLHDNGMRLTIQFDDASNYDYSAEYLRVESPSAEVQGHGPGQKTLISGRREVGIMQVEPVGHYAIRIVFDDLHDSGIYSWAYLHTLGREQAERGAAYEDALAAKGLSRDPPRRT